jgi:hypothetical protein
VFAINRKVLAASALVVGLVLLFGAAALDMVMEAHRKALAIGIVGAVLTLFATAYHMFLPPQRGHTRSDRMDD